MARAKGLLCRAAALLAAVLLVLLSPDFTLRVSAHTQNPIRNGEVNVMGKTDNV